VPVCCRMKSSALLVSDTDSEVSEEVDNAGIRFTRLVTASRIAGIDREVKSIPDSSTGIGAIAPLPFGRCLLLCLLRPVAVRCLGVEVS